MSVKEAVIRLVMKGKDETSQMLDKVGLSGNKLARSMAKVNIEAKKAKDGMGGMAAGTADLRDFGGMIMGAVTSISGFINGMRDMEIAGEKALNAQRSLQLMIGDTSQVLVDATTATRGLVEATDLEVMIRKFAGLGISIGDVMLLLEGATKLSFTTQKKITDVGSALMTAMAGRATSLKLLGVEVEGIELSAAGIAGAISKSLGGVDMDAFVTKAQQQAVFLANVRSNNEVMAAKSGGFMHTVFGSVAEAGLEAAKLTVNLREGTDVSDAQVVAIGEQMRLQREIKKILDDAAEVEAKERLPAAKFITEQMLIQAKIQAGATTTQIALGQERAFMAKLKKQQVESAQEELDLEKDIQDSLSVQAGLRAKIKTETAMMRPILEMNAALSRIIAGKDPKKPPRRGGRRRGKRGSEFADTIVGRASSGPDPLLMTAGVADDAQLAAIAKTVHAFEELDAARAESHAAVQMAMRARDDGASLQRARDSRAQLEQDHANTIREINFDLNEALAEADRRRIEESAERSAQAYEAQGLRIAKSVEDSISGFGESGEHMSGLTQAFRGAATGGIALAKSYDDVKKNTPGFIAAIGQATASQVSNESARAGIMAGITMADAIHAFLVTPPPGTRYDLLAWGAVAAAMYGAQALMPSKPGAAAGGAGTKGASSRSARPIDTGAGADGGGFTVNFYANAPIVHGGTQSGASELAGIALSVAGTGMGEGGAV